MAAAVKFCNRENIVPEAIDPVEFGKLVQAVSTLTGTVEKLNVDVKNLNLALSSGRGVAVGLMIAAGGVGAGVAKVLGKLFG